MCTKIPLLSAEVELADCSGVAPDNKGADSASGVGVSSRSIASLPGSMEIRKSSIFKYENYHPISIKNYTTLVFSEE